MVDRCATYTQIDSTDMVRRVPKRRRETERFVTDQATYTLAGPPELRWGNLKAEVCGVCGCRGVRVGSLLAACDMGKSKSGRHGDTAW